MVICILCVLALPAVNFLSSSLPPSMLLFVHFTSVMMSVKDAEPFSVAHLLHFRVVGCDSGVDSAALHPESSCLTEWTCSYSTQRLQVVFRKLQRQRRTSVWKSDGILKNVFQFHQNQWWCCVMYCSAALHAVVLPAHWTATAQKVIDRCGWKWDDIHPIISHC